MSEVYVSFPDADLATANELAADLRERLAEETPDVDARQVRENEDNQDLGAVLALVLGAPSVVILARGLSAWIGGHKVKVRVSRYNTDGKKDEFDFEGRAPEEALRSFLQDGQPHEQ